MNNQRLQITKLEIINIPDIYFQMHKCINMYKSNIIRNNIYVIFILVIH